VCFLLLATAISASRNLRGLTTVATKPKEHPLIPIKFKNHKLPSISLSDQHFSAYGFNVGVSGIKCEDITVGVLDIKAQKIAPPPVGADYITPSPAPTPSGGTEYTKPPTSSPTAATVYNTNLAPAGRRTSSKANEGKQVKLDLSATGIRLKCSATYNYKLDFWPYYPKGSGDVSMVAARDTNVKGAVIIDGLGKATVPTLEMVDGSCEGTIDVLADQIEFSNGITRHVLEFFKGKLASTVQSTAKTQLCGAVTAALPSLDTSMFSNELQMLNMLTYRA